MSLRTNLQRLQTQTQQLTMQRDSLLRLLMEVIVEHGGEAEELIVSHIAANALDLRRFVIDTLPTPDGRMAIRRRDVTLQPQPGVTARAWSEAEPELEETEISPEPEPPEETAPPCGCGHEKAEHVAGIGSCRRGDCFCEGYDAAAGA